jgi:sec-independent protein translocase protein TatB
VFGLSFGEIVLIGIVAMVVVGPRNMIPLMRTAGQAIGKLRRMANDLRAESGIDEILNAEGIRSEIDNFRRLASGALSPEDLSPNVVPDREREYPRAGPDACGAFSEDIIPYLPAVLPLPEPPAAASAEAGEVASLPGAAPATASPSPNGAGKN